MELKFFNKSAAG